MHIMHCLGSRGTRYIGQTCTGRVYYHKATMEEGQINYSKILRSNLVQSLLLKIANLTLSRGANVPRYSVI